MSDHFAVDFGTDRDRARTLIRARIGRTKEILEEFKRQVTVNPSAAIVAHSEKAMQAQYFLHGAEQALELVASKATVSELQRGIAQLKSSIEAELLGTGIGGPGPWTPSGSSLIAGARVICESNARRELVRLYVGVLRILQH